MDNKDKQDFYIAIALFGSQGAYMYISTLEIFCNRNNLDIMYKSISRLDR